MKTVPCSLFGAAKHSVFAAPLNHLETLHWQPWWLGASWAHKWETAPVLVVVPRNRGAKEPLWKFRTVFSLS
jgi:hypothetical protein